MRVHPKVQMLRGARLAVQHSKDWLAVRTYEDLEQISTLMAAEIRTLPEHGRRAYRRAIASNARRAAYRVLVADA